MRREGGKVATKSKMKLTTHRESMKTTRDNGMTLFGLGFDFELIARNLDDC